MTFSTHSRRGSDQIMQRSLLYKAALVSLAAAATAAGVYAALSSILGPGLALTMAVAAMVGASAIVLFACLQQRNNMDDWRDVLGQIAALSRGAIIEVDADLNITNVIDRSGAESLAPLVGLVGHPLCGDPIGVLADLNKTAASAVRRQHVIRNVDLYIQDDFGEPQRLRFSAWPRTGSNGLFAGYIGQVRPYVDRSEADFALAQSERALRSLIDNLPGAVCLKDLGGTTLISNHAYEMIQGESTEFQDMAWAIGNPSATGDAQASTTTEQELTIDDKIYSVVAFPINNHDGKIDGVGSLIWDITQRRKEQLELSRSRDQLRLFVDNLPAGAALVSDDETARINASLETMTGYSRNQLRTVNDWFRLAYGDQSAKAEARYREIKNLRQPARIKATVRRADGEMRVFELSVSFGSGAEV
jgi:PAS domain S-box-containing protein